MGKSITFDAFRAFYVGVNKLRGLLVAQGRATGDPAEGAAERANALGQASSLFSGVAGASEWVRNTTTFQVGQRYKYRGEAWFRLRTHDDWRDERRLQDAPRLGLWLIEIPDPTQGEADGARTVTWILLSGTGEGQISTVLDGQVGDWRGGSMTEALFEELMEWNGVPGKTQRSGSRWKEPPFLGNATQWLIGDDGARQDVEVVFETRYAASCPIDGDDRVVSYQGWSDASLGGEVPVSRIVLGTPYLVQFAEGPDQRRTESEALLLDTFRQYWGAFHYSREVEDETLSVECARVQRGDNRVMHADMIGQHPERRSSLARTVMIRSKAAVERDLQAAIAGGDALLVAVPADEEAMPAFRAAYLSWESRTRAVLERSFNDPGLFGTGPLSEFNGTSLNLLDLRVSSAAFPFSRLQEIVEDVRERQRVLGTIVDRLDLLDEDLGPGTTKQTRVDIEGPIFLVHGRDELPREKVRHFVERVTGREVIVLAEQANGGQDLLGKLLTNAANASFAIVLLTPDDVGGLEGAAPNPRARQNVVFELGLFIGLLGRERVAALHYPGVEIPTDFAGVAYIPGGDGAWKLELGRELRAAGIPVDMDRAL